jgi:hypothetical protein
MKFFFLAVCLSLGMSSFAQTDISFKEKKHSFGKIKKDVPATYIFTFTNKASKPVVIEFANAECGCTKPEYSQAPIAVGKTSTIKVTYNAATLGAFKKNVDVKFAHSNQPYTLTIDGEVIEAKKK